MFHQGAATPVTAYLSVGSKAAGFIVLLRVLNAFRHFPPVSDKIVLATVILAALNSSFTATSPQCRRTISSASLPIRASPTPATSSWPSPAKARKIPALPWLSHSTSAATCS